MLTYMQTTNYNLSLSFFNEQLDFRLVMNEISVAFKFLLRVSCSAIINF